MKKRVLIALAAALSVTLAAVCTAGVISSARSSEPAPSTQSSADASSSPSGETGTGLTETSAAAEAESAEEELYYASWQSLGSGTLLENAKKIRYVAPDSELLADLDRLASGEYTEEQVAEIVQNRFSGSDWKEHQVRQWLRYWRACDEAENEDGTINEERLYEAYQYAPGDSMDMFTQEEEKVRNCFPGISKVQMRTLILRYKLAGMRYYSYENLLVLGIMTPDTPKLTPEKAKEIIAQYDGPTEGRTKAIVQEFLKVQPVADEAYYYEPYSCNSKDNWYTLCEVIEFVTQDDTGNTHIIAAGDGVFVFHLVQDTSGNMLDFEVLLEPEREPFMDLATYYSKERDRSPDKEIFDLYAAQTVPMPVR